MQTRRPPLPGNRPSGSLCTGPPVGVRGRSGTAPGLKDHRQQQGLCLQTVGGQSRASVLELADLVRKHFVRRRGLGFVQVFSPGPVLRRPATPGPQGVLAPSQPEAVVLAASLSLGLPPTCQPPFFGLTPESPRLTHTSSGCGPSVTAVPSRPGAGASSFLSAQLRKPGPEGGLPLWDYDDGIRVPFAIS